MSKNTSFTIVVSLEYNVIFDDEPIIPIETLLAGIPTNTIMEIIGHYSALIFTKEQNTELQINILAAWLIRLSPKIAFKVTKSIQKIQSQGGKFVFLSNQTSLLFIEKVLLNYTEGETRNLTIEEENNLFKAYLLVAQEWIDKQENSMSEIKLKSSQDIAQFALPVLLPYDDLKSYRDFRWQVYKSIKFFRFIENHKTINLYLQPFYDHYSITSWKEYLLFTVGTILQLYSEGNRSILITTENDKINELLNALSLNTEEFEIKNDFISLREKPVYKLESRRYLIYNYSIFIDKIFQAIIFDFGTILRANNIIESIPEFKSNYISKYFFEQEFLYNEIDYIIGNRKKTIAIDGLRWQELSRQEGPDYYVRCGSKVFIIEFKDAIFQANAKVSQDLKLISEELRVKLIENKKGKPKGVTQLARTVNSISSNDIKVDQLNIENLKIYPLLIVTDEAYNSFGVNYLMKNEYKNLLDEKSKYLSKDLIIVHIDNLIELRDLLHDKRVPVQWLLDWYIEYTNKKESLFDEFLSFSHFIRTELQLRGYKEELFPRELYKELPTIFNTIETKVIN